MINKMIKNIIIATGLFVGGLIVGLSANTQPTQATQEVYPQVVAHQEAVDGDIQITLEDGTDFSFKYGSRKVEVDEILTESTDCFYISEGEYGVTFTDGSWISANPSTGHYEFQPVDLGDWSMEFDNLRDLENCVKTYLSTKNNGWF